MTTAPSARIRVRAIAFDLDGTLLDTIHDLATAINLMLARLNRPALPKDTIRAMVGKGMANLVRRALAAAQGSPPTRARLRCTKPTTNGSSAAKRSCSPACAKAWRDSPAPASGSPA